MIPATHGVLTRTVTSTALVAVATIASMFALTEVVEAGAWTRAGVVGVLLVAACTGLVRHLLLARAINRGGANAGRNREQAADRAAGTVSFLATLAGLAVATWYVLARYGGRDGGAGPFPGPDAWRGVTARFAEATEIMVTERAPVADSLPMGLVAVSGTLLMFLVADSLAGARMPALAGLPLLVLWTPALSIIGRVPAGTFVVAVTAALLLLTLDQGGSPTATNGREDAPVARARRSRAWITAVSSVVVAVLALGTGAGIAAVPGVSGNFSQLFRTQGQSLELSDEFDMRAGLGERSTAEVLRYRIGREAQRGPLRERTFTAWDGRRVSWDPDDATLAPFEPGRTLMSGPEETGNDITRLAVEIAAERDGLLPIPVGPRRVELPQESRADWRWDPVLDEVRSDGRLAAGTRYDVEILHRRLSAAALRAAPDGAPDGDHTALVETEHLADTAALAAEITRDAGTRYDQAVALQNWLHHGGGFTYTADTAPARTDDATWDFLTDRQGYCVQFSTAFFVMARSLGIPTRIGVGYLPGDDEDGDGVWTVTGEDSHSWPEVWFDGFGWVRFEPTPQVQTGALPDYADSTQQSGDAPSRAPEDPRPTRDPQDDPEREEPTAQAEATPEATAGGRGASGEPLPWWVWAGAAVLVLAAGAAGAWLLLRRRADAVALDPERAWERVVAALAARGVALGPSTTLRRAPEEIAEQVARSGNRLPEEAVDALVTLARAAENERYARDYESPDPAELEELTGTITAGLTAALGDPDDTPAAQAAKILTQALRR